MTHPVTDHAVVRYFERIHGMTHLAGCYHRDPDRAAAGAAILGITLDEARNLVCPPRLHRALRLGDGIVKGADRVLRCVDGRVVPCFAPAVKSRKAMPRETRVA